MKVTEIARSFSKTIQTEPYEPVNIFASYKAEVSETDDLEKASAALYEKAMTDVMREVESKLWERYSNPKKYLKSKQPF